MTGKDAELIKQAPELLAAVDKLKERLAEMLRKSYEYYEMLWKREAEE